MRAKSKSEFTLEAVPERVWMPARGRIGDVRADDRFKIDFTGLQNAA